MDRGRYLGEYHGLFVALLACLVASPSDAGDMTGLVRGLAAPLKVAHRRPPPTPRGDAVEHLADGIDWLRHELDQHGSIVAKEPDVWGQSRLLRHRVEFEQELHRQLGAFATRSSAAIRRSDQAFLGMALAVQSALPPLGDQAGRPDAAPLVRAAPFAPLGDATVAGFDGAALALEPVVHVDQLARYLRHIQAARRVNEGDDTADAPGYALNLVRIPVSILPGRLTRKGHGAEITLIAEPCLDEPLLPNTFRSLVINDLIDVIAPALTWCVNDPACVAWAEAIAGDTTPARPAAQRLAVLRALATRIPVASPAAAPRMKTRRSRLPIPFSQLAEVSGTELMAALIHDTRRSLAAHPAASPCIAHVDVRGHLAEELEAAYEFLARERHRGVWLDLAGWRLPELVRGRRSADLADIRCRFLRSLSDELLLPAGPEPVAGGDACYGHTPAAAPLCRTTTAALAWGILVESALLDERLAADMRESGAICSAPCYGPEPATEARIAFNEHVRRRWPIRVFALDPVTDEQNVEDAFARRRESQIALAVAAAGGRTGTQAALRGSRRLETDLATIAVNRTAVAFSHGSDTFGWRFFPRVQTPPTRGGLAAVAESVCGGPTSDTELMQRQLEPGPRDCTALVVMPAFVPLVRFDVRTCWLSLVHPQATDQSLRRSTRLARAVESLREEQADAAAACPDAAAAVHGLARELERLARRLPLQSLAARIPFENTAGGFELFTSGVTDLAPELLGWYGGPGVDPARATTLFLVGKGFSVHDTLVIAGGRPASSRLLSRELLQVEIPPGTATLVPDRSVPRQADTPPAPSATAPEPLPPPSAMLPPAVIPTPAPSGTIAACSPEYVDIHLATPYGVSGHLLVPVHRRDDTADGPALDAATIRLSFTVAHSAASGGPVARVDEFFAATSEAVAVRMPRAFVPPAKAMLQFTVRDGATPVAGFSCDAPSYDARGSRYLVAGGELRNLVGDTSRPASDKTLRGGVKPYLDHLLAQGRLAADGDPVTLTVSAVLVAGQQEIPLTGGLTVVATRRGRSSDLPTTEETPSP